MTGSVYSIHCPLCDFYIEEIPPTGAWCGQCERPVLRGRPDGSGLDVWCQYCRRDHHHGRHSWTTGCQYDSLRPGRRPCTCPPGTGDGHRVAHCHDNGRSPYRDGGYIVVEVGEFQPAKVAAQ